MIKIIDKTLTAVKLEEQFPTGEMLQEMCVLLAALGVDYVELTVPILERMGNLPKGIQYILALDHIEDKAHYKGFAQYVSKSSSALMEEDILYELQVKDLDELEQLEEIKQKKNLRVTGLDELMCTDYKKGLKLLKEKFNINLDFCPRNGCYCATALAMEWLINGGKSVSVSFNGIGGYASLEEVLVGITVIINKKRKVNMSILPRITKRYEQLTKSKLSYNKAVIGKNIFNVEEMPSKYEPYDPNLVGKVRRVIIGKNSGKESVKVKLQEKGVLLPEEKLELIVQEVKSYSIVVRRSLTESEFQKLVEEATAK